MVENNSLYPSIAWLYVLIPIFYVLLKRYLDHRFIKKQSLSDEDSLARIAYQNKCSEFDLFQCAGAQWHIPYRQIAGDFKIYLRKSDLPHYVRDYVRKHKPERNTTVRDVIDSGGNLPPSWSA
jgi:hypothetical protein